MCGCSSSRANALDLVGSEDVTVVDNGLQFVPNTYVWSISQLVVALLTPSRSFLTDGLETVGSERCNTRSAHGRNEHLPGLRPT